MTYNITELIEFCDRNCIYTEFDWMFLPETDRARDTALLNQETKRQFALILPDLLNYIAYEKKETEYENYYLTINSNHMYNIRREFGLPELELKTLYKIATGFYYYKRDKENNRIFTRFENEPDFETVKKLQETGDLFLTFY